MREKTKKKSTRLKKIIKNKTNKYMLKVTFLCTSTTTLYEREKK